MKRIEVVERFPNIWSWRWSCSTQNCIKNIRLSRMCSVLDGRGFLMRECRWVQQQRFDSKVLHVTKYGLILRKYLTLFMEMDFYAGSMLLCKSISTSWTLPGAFLASEERGMVIRWTTFYVFLKPQNYNSSSFRFWMTSLCLLTVLEIRCVACSVHKCVNLIYFVTFK
jgi:hypothetical protein